jgi:hypothetical protein
MSVTRAGHAFSLRARLRDRDERADDGAPDAARRHDEAPPPAGATGLVEARGGYLPLNSGLRLPT